MPQYKVMITRWVSVPQQTCVCVTAKDEDDAMEQAIAQNFDELPMPTFEYMDDKTWIHPDDDFINENNIVIVGKVEYENR